MKIWRTRDGRTGYNNNAAEAAQSRSWVSSNGIEAASIGERLMDVDGSINWLWRNLQFCGFLQTLRHIALHFKANSRVIIGGTICSISNQLLWHQVTVVWTITRTYPCPFVSACGRQCVNVLPRKKAFHGKRSHWSPRFQRRCRLNASKRSILKECWVKNLWQHSATHSTVKCSTQEGLTTASSAANWSGIIFDSIKTPDTTGANRVFHIIDFNFTFCIKIILFWQAKIVRVRQSLTSLLFIFIYTRKQQK